MSNTPKLKLVELSNGASQALVVNTGGYSILDQMVDRTVKSRGVNSPPSTPADGDSYIVGTSPTGLWAGKSNQIAYWRNSSGVWQFIVPLEGWTVRVQDDDDANGIPKEYGYTGAAWVRPEGALTNPMTAAGDLIRGGTSGAPTRVPIGTAGQVLTVSGGVPTWAAPTGGMTNPMTASGDLIYGGASGTPTRLAAGTNGYVLTLAGGIPTWSAPSGGGGLTNITEGLSTSAPNATNNVASLTVTGGTAQTGLALVPRGFGPLMGQVPDGTNAGGNSRGLNATDWQRSRSLATQVASGQYSAILGGAVNTASGGYSICGGNNNTASQTNSLAIGVNCTSSGTAAIAMGNAANASGANSVALGYFSTASGGYASALGGYANTASGDYSSVVGGVSATTRGLYAAEARASGRFSFDGDAQRGRYNQYRQTTDATQTTLSADGGTPSSTTIIVMPNNAAYVFSGRVVARSNATGNAAAWEVKGLCKRGANAASTALVGTPTVTAIAADSGASGWSLAVSADTTNGALIVQVTGVAATTIKWVADIETVEVVG